MQRRYRVISRFDKLKSELDPPSERASTKVVDFISPEIQEFIRKCPFAVLSTSNCNGDCDSLPKGGFPGFIKVLDDRSLLIPDISKNLQLTTQLRLVLYSKDVS